MRISDLVEIMIFTNLRILQSKLKFENFYFSVFKSKINFEINIFLELLAHNARFRFGQNYDF